MLNRKNIMLAAIAGVLSLGSAAVPVNAESDNFAVTSNGQTTVLPSSSTTGNEKAGDILGDAQYFGITANEWKFNGEAESSAAVKKFTHQSGEGGQTGVTDKAEGSIHGYSMIGSVDSPFMIKGVGETIITPESEKNKFTNSTSGKLDFEIKSEKEIDSKIDSMLEHAANESDRLAKLDSIKDYSVIPSNQMTIDVTSAGTKTVYINVDKADGLKNALKQSSGLTIKKNAGQVVVLNFDDEDVNVNKLEIDQNGQKYGGDSLANVSTAKNAIATELVFNMPNATKAELHNVTGIVLAPKATIDTYDVTGGWLVADKVINHCEHHFTNGELPTSLDVFKDETPDTPKPTEQPAQPTEEPAQPTEEPVKPALRKAKFRVHAFRVKNNVAKPESNLNIEVTKTAYEIPEKEQNESDKNDTRTSDEIKINDIVKMTTDENGDTETELDKGSYLVEAKRVNAPVVEEGDKTNVYVHSDATLTGNAIEEGNKFTVKQIEEDEPEPVKKQYTLTFNSDGGSEVESVTADEGTVKTIDETPTREGYTFDGWYDGDTKVETVTFDKDVTLTAKWKKNEVPQPTEEPVQPTETPDTPVQPTETPAVPTDTPVTPTEQPEQPAQPTEEPAQPTETPETKKYTVTFVTNGGSEVKPITANEDSKVEISTVKVSKPGYKFDGWYSDEKLTTEVKDLTLDKDYTVYAKWSEETKPTVKPTAKPASKPSVKPSSKPAQQQISKVEDGRTGTQTNPAVIYGSIAVAAAVVLIVVAVVVNRKSKKNS